MDKSKVVLLKQRAIEVRDEQDTGENTANRVGSLLKDMIDYDGEQTDAINSLQNQVNTIINNGGGGGGGEGSGGGSSYQKIYFLNIPHSDETPHLPGVDEYREETDDFLYIAENQLWITQNNNPGDGEDTWVMYAWFATGANTPNTTSGPIRVYNSEAQGSSGEDTDQLEFIYKLAPNKLDANSLNEWTSYLENAKTGGSTSSIGGKAWTQKDAIPVGWTDNPQGIDENHRVEYYTYRESSVVNGQRVWGNTGFHAPMLWSSYGENGMDGDGVEYIFFVGTRVQWGTVENQNPSDTTVAGWNPSTEAFQQREYTGPSGSLWRDDPIDLDDNSYPEGTQQWVSMRKYNGETKRWEAFSEPALWNYKALNGVTDGYIINLDNNNMPVGVGDSNDVSSYTNICRVQAFHLASEMNCVADGSNLLAGSNNFYYRVGTPSRSDEGSITGISASAGTGANINIITVTLTNVSNMKGTIINIPVDVYLPGSTDNNPIVYHKTISMYGVASGVDGEAIDLWVGSTSLHCDYYSQNVFPSTVKVGVKINGAITRPGSDGVALASGNAYTFEYAYSTINGGTVSEGTKYSINNNGINPAVWDDSDEYKYITVYMYLNGSAQPVDSQIITYTRDGYPSIGPNNHSIQVLSSSLSKGADDDDLTGDIQFKVIKTDSEHVWELMYSYQDDYFYWFYYDENHNLVTSNTNNELSITLNNTTWDNLDFSLNGSAISYDNGKFIFEPSGMSFQTAHPAVQILYVSDVNAPLASVVVPIIQPGATGARGQDGQDGQDGTGVQALGGVVTRIRNWASATTDGCGDIGNGVEADSYGVIYKDIVYYNGNYWFIAPTYTSSRDPQDLTAPSANSRYWFLVNLNLAAAFQVLLAEDAFINNLTVRELIVVDNTYGPIAGMTSGNAIKTNNYDLNGTAITWYNSTKGNIRIWAGYDDSADLFNSAFYVTDRGYLKANHAEISGIIHASSGDFSGTIKASTLYREVYDLQGSITIDPSVHGSSFTWCGISAVTVTLPSAASYKGIELQFYVPFLVRSNAYPITLQCGSGDTIYYPDPNSASSMLTTLSNSSRVFTDFNVLVTVKSIPNSGTYDWYVITGTVNAPSS